MSKFFTKKVVAGIVAIALGLGIIFGDMSKINDYLDQAMDYVSEYVSDQPE